MSFQIKSIRYQDAPRSILLQNSNGPCPLLAAANALLLRGAIHISNEFLHCGAISVEQVVNLLADWALHRSRTSHASEYHLNEVLTLLPSLQRGMDVNPKFTCGVTGVEYTNNMAVIDLLGLELVHGWLLDPQDEETQAIIGTKSYNQLMELLLRANEAKESLQNCKQTSIEIEHLNQRNMSELISDSDVVNDFLISSSHQLTHYGLVQLHNHLSEDALCIFFRNNHFATLTKHNSLLHLLVTDLGYAHTPEIVWERLSAIDGDTEYANEFFQLPTPRQEWMPQATILKDSGGVPCQEEWMTEQQRFDHDSEQLARQLQELEYARNDPPASTGKRPETGRSPARVTNSSRSQEASSKCSVS